MPALLARRTGTTALSAKDLVVGLVIGGEAKAYAFDDLSERPMVNDTVAGSNVVVVFDAGSDTGSVFSRDIDGRALEFSISEGADSGYLVMTDRETGSEWLLLTGEAISGPMQGTRLEQLPSNYSFWFAWKDWHPSTGLFARDGAA